MSNDWRRDLDRSLKPPTELGKRLARTRANRLALLAPQLLLPRLVRGELEREWGKQLSVHRGGLRREPDGLEILWGELLSLDEFDQRSLPDGGGTLFRTIRLHTKDRVLVIDRTYRKSQRIVDMVRELAEPHVEASLERRMEELKLEQGFVLRYGNWLTATKTGLKVGRELHPWGSIELYGRDGASLVVKAGGRTLLAERLWRIPRYKELLFVLEKMAPQGSPRHQVR